MDILNNDNFDVELDASNDIATVDGKEADLQSVKRMVTAYFFEEIGDVHVPNAKAKIRMLTYRVARDNPRVDNVEDIRPVVTKPGVMEVRIIFSTDDDFDFKIVQ